MKTEHHHRFRPSFFLKSLSLADHLTGPELESLLQEMDLRNWRVEVDPISLL